MGVLARLIESIRSDARQDAQDRQQIAETLDRGERRAQEMEARLRALSTRVQVITRNGNGG